ncbi:MAG: SDR family NAD(P)-dependent oxidoreductase [Gammaproteobacteria bacterium]
MVQVTASNRLAGTRAVITGAGSGIGRATTLRFALEGADVLAVDMNGESVEQTVRLANNSPGRVVPKTCDITGAGAPAAVRAACLDAFGPINALVNNAGIGAARPVHETEDEALDRFTDVNLRSVFRMSREALIDMREHGGCIVNLSSIFGLRGFPTSSIYSATKAALIGLTQNMAADYGPLGIRVNAIAPGVIETPLTADRLRDNAWFRDSLLNATPLGRTGQPEEVAAAIGFLCSHDAAFITGQVLAVDGGWSTTKFQPMP